MNYNSENYFDQEITFTYEGKDYLWIGDYSIEHTGEDESEFAPAYGEMEITINHTQSLSSYDYGFYVIPTPSMLMALELEIERNY
jgi:hypothetical protein